MVFDPCTEDTLVIIRSNFFRAVISNTLSKESSDVVWFHSEYRGADDLIIKRFEIFLLAEHNVSRTFYLLDSPRIAKPERFRNGAVTPGKSIENLMESFRIDTL